MTRPGLEPGISGSGGRRLIHLANRPLEVATVVDTSSKSRISQGQGGSGQEGKVGKLRQVLKHEARVSRAGARTGLQLQGHGDMQGFGSSSLAMRHERSFVC